MAFHSLAMTMIPILFLLFLHHSFASASAGCRVPPQFWCDNPDIAAECGVTKHCKVFQHSNSNNLVDFTLYYESMCPDCKNFFKSQLNTAYQKVGSIMNLTLVPYGNARYHNVSYLPFKHSFECQHGPEECIGNMLETCAINIYKNISIYYPFISCVENSTDLPRKAAVQCATNFKLDYTKIMNCVNSYQGYVWEYEMAMKTDSLEPQHTWVPWVTLNGVHTDEIQTLATQDLVKLICTTYTGSPKPAACSEGLPAVCHR